MKASILVATPNVGIGVLINQSLEEAGGYSIKVVKNGEETLKQLNNTLPKICILDAGIADLNVNNLIDQIKVIDKNVSIIVIPKGEEQGVADDGYSEVDAILPFPFYNPDFLSMVDDILKKQNLSETKPSKVGSSELDLSSDESKPNNISAGIWQEDVTATTAYLSLLSNESSAQGSVITHDGKVWAFTGVLSLVAAKKIALSIEKFFVDRGGSDLARYIQLDDSEKDNMLYATSLGEDYVLATIFDSNIPFSKIRSKANKLAKELKNMDSQTSDDEIKKKLLPHKQNLLKIRSLLENGSSNQKEKDLQFEKPIINELPAPDKIGETNLAETQVSDTNIENNQRHTDNILSEQDKNENLAETVITKVSEDLQIPTEIELEPVSPSIYNLTYACVLIPRFSEQFLAGNRASRLSEWVTQLCLAFGWRLEHLSVRPEYIQWIVNVPPSTSPGYLIRIIRQHTSRRMLNEFPKLGTNNPSGDFWAPGYLIMNGNQPPPAKLIKDFIKNSRTRQGV